MMAAIVGFVANHLSQSSIYFLLDFGTIDLAVAPDTGSLEGELRAILGSVRRLVHHPLVRRILPDLHAEMLHNPDLARAVRGRLQTERRQRVEVIIRRAITREEIGPDVNLELVNDALGGLVYWRMIVTDGRTDRAYIERLAAFIGAALRARRSLTIQQSRR